MKVIHGDCLDALKAIPDCTVDSVVTDPPYALSDLRKRDGYCLRQILSEVHLPGDDDRDAEGGERGSLPSPPVSVSALRRVDGAVGVHPRVGVPEGAVDFQCSPVGQQEIDYAHVAPERATDGNLALELDSEPGEFLGDFVLKPADGLDLPFCDVSCSCFAELGKGRLRVTVALPSSTGGHLAGALFGTHRTSNAHIGFSHNPGGVAEPASAVMAATRAETRAVLSLDLSRRTGELCPADDTCSSHPVFLLVPTELVGAGTRAGRLPSPLEAARVSIVGDGADGAFTLHGPWHKLNLTRTAKGFMGKTWDGWDTPGSYQRWCYAWAQEVFRVLKPGGHLLAFGGTRTYHRLTCGLEDAGFECRDTLQWLHSQGFPKNLDVSKAIDKMAKAEREVVGQYVSPEGTSGRSNHVERIGLSTRIGGLPDITAPATDEAKRWAGFGTAMKPSHEPIVLARKPLDGTVAATVTRWGTGALNIGATRVGTGEDKRTAGTRTYQRFDPSSPSKGIQPAPHDGLGRWPPNVVLVHDASCNGECVPGCPVAELDQQTSHLHSSGSPKGPGGWDSEGGWGFIGKGPYGQARVGDSGGASRFFKCFRMDQEQDFFPIESGMWPQPGDASTTDVSTPAGRKAASSADSSPTGGYGSKPTELSLTGTRYTTSITTPSTTTSPISSASQPNGTTTTTSDSARSTDGSTASKNDIALGATSGVRSPSTTCDEPGPGAGTANLARSNTDVGGSPPIEKHSTPSAANGTPADFPADYPTFRYCAKPSTREKSAGLDGRNPHPTTKPVELCRWLARLVTPPGGVVLDPFAGSGTVGVAAILEGFDPLLVEAEAEYLPVIEGRLAWALGQAPAGVERRSRPVAEPSPAVVGRAGLGVSGRSRRAPDPAQGCLFDGEMVG